MPLLSDSQDVYRICVEEAEENWLFGLVRFAIIEEQRFEWMRHFNENNGSRPSEADIREWYEQQPPGVLLRAKGTAENALQLYADEVLQEILSDERREVADGVIVNEIRLMRKFWPQFGIGVAAGLVSAFLFAVIVTSMYFILIADASPEKSAAAILGHSTQEMGNGEESIK